MSNLLFKIIVEAIETAPKKRITFAEYMGLALYHPQYGYYSSGNVKIGSAGKDFYTSPYLGADYGELLAEQLRDIWLILEKPNPFMLVEMGAGEGILAADILNYFQQQEPDLLQVLEYTIVERSPGLIKAQQKQLQNWLDRNIKISWKNWEEIEDNSLVGCCFSNELVDAFPVHLITIAGEEIKEIYLTKDGEYFKEIIGELSTPKIKEYFQLVEIDFNPKLYPNGYRTEVNLAALNWIETVAKKLKQGYSIAIDYGYSATKYYHPQRSSGTLQCYYQHRRHNNPYSNIGMQDITAHVDFTALQNKGSLWGLETIEFTKQSLFLMALGLGDRIADLSSGKYNITELLNRRDALHQLIDPSGLGGFGVLIQAKNLTKIQKQQQLKGLKNPSKVK
ncbi:MAG: class I SAM-dependent methyltransferase [Prochloraceae cyanobacterium]